MIGGKPPKHKDEKSTRTVRQERYNKDGTPLNEGKLWGKSDMDLFMTLYLNNEPELTIAKALGRSWKSIDTYRWKIVDRKQTKGYVPDCLERRDATVYNQRELWFLRMCMKKGWTSVEIARTTGREPTAIESKIKSLQEANRPTLF